MPVKGQTEIERFSHRLDQIIDELLKLKSEVSDSIPGRRAARKGKAKFRNPETGETFRPSR